MNINTVFKALLGLASVATPLALAAPQTAMVLGVVDLIVVLAVIAWRAIHPTPAP